jgi:hypothetical protein
VSVVFGQEPTDYQQNLITEKVLTFHKEHLFPVVLTGMTEEEIDFDMDWWNQAELFIGYGFSTNSTQDYDINRQLLRYLEISVVPIVFYDDVTLQLESHDEELDDYNECKGCECRYDNRRGATVLSTSKVYNDFTGA